MFKTHHRTLVRLLPYLFSLPTPAIAQCNGEIARAFYREVIRDRDLSAVPRLIADNYIQHSANVADGREGVYAALERLNSASKPQKDSPSPILRTVCEGNLVVLFLGLSLPGMELAVVDLFRVADGKLAEHWEAVESIPADNASAITGGTTEIDAAANYQDSKFVVRDFYTKVWLSDEPERIDAFVSASLTQHSADIEGGLVGLRRTILEQKGFQPDKLHRVIAQGDFVAVQLEGHQNNVPFVAYDILRVEKRKIVEMWRVQQAVPSQLPHTNGMIQ